MSNGTLQYHNVVITSYFRIMAHIGTGKTTATECVYYAGKSHKISVVHEGGVGEGSSSVWNRSRAVTSMGPAD